MQTTSHFIGLKLKPELFSDLFVRLQRTLGDHTDALEFQNILSVHITLFYLPQELTLHDEEKIQDTVRRLDAGLLNQGLQGFDYFGDPETPRLCYLIPHTDKLTDWNALLQKTFPEHQDIPDNLHPVFIPHITLFKIRNMSIFLLVRNALENIMREELEKLTFADIFDHIGLFAVNSGFHPEIQVERDFK